MKSLLYILFTFLFLHSTFSQKIERMTPIGDKEVKATLKYVEKSDDDDIFLYLLKQEMVTTGGATENYLTKISIDKQFNLKEEFVNSWKTTKYQEAGEKVVKMYKPSLETNLIVQSGITYNYEVKVVFDPLAVGYDIESKKQDALSLAQSEISYGNVQSLNWQGSTKDVFVGEKIFIHNQNKTFSRIIGLIHKGKGSGKNTQYKDIYVVTYNANGSIKHSFPVKLEYPRRAGFERAFTKGADDTGYLGAHDGFFYILGRVSGLGKSNDPDESNYHAILADEEGKEVFSYNFQFSAEGKPGNLGLIDAKKFGEEVVVLGKTISSKPSLLFLKFNKSGLAIKKEFSFKDFEKIHKGDAQHILKPRFGHTFHVNDILTLPNGDYAVVVQNLVIDSKMVPNTQPGGSPVPQSVTTYDYSNLSVLYFTQEGDLKSYTSLPSPNNTMPSKVDIINKDNDKINFLVQYPLRESNEQDIFNFKKYTSPSALITSKNRTLYSPSVVSFNINNGQFTEVLALKNEYMLFNEVPYLFSDSNGFCYIFGFESNQGQNVFMMKAVKL